jgi:CelD/BcsL family acetyltransferase involved in cellulose biosynthesis
MVVIMPALRVVRFDKLTPADLDAWHRLRDADPAYDSPYFHPGFAAAVHASGRPVHMVVSRERGQITGLLAGHKEGKLLRPAGWPAADFQGPILARGAEFPPLDVLSASGVRGFEFDHLLETATGFAPWVESSRPSPYVDITGGLDAYLGRASKSGKDNMAQARRRAAKAERELGPLRFEVDTVDEVALAKVVELKRAQYAATGARDYFAEPDRVRLLKRLMHTRDASFGGILSTIHAGPHLLAAHFGMRAGGVLHWWFPVYDPMHAKLAPGWILLRALVEAGAALGISRIDLGRGEDEYKRRAKTGETNVSQGMVTRSGTLRVWRRAKESLVSSAKASAFGPTLRKAKHALRRTR